MSPKSGVANMAWIYEIRNIVTDVVYIGSTNNWERRVKQHIYQLRKNKHANAYLQNAWNKYGENCFVFNIIEEVDDIIQYDKEQEYINNLLLFDKSIYNICTDVYDPKERKPLVKKCHNCDCEYTSLYNNQKYCPPCSQEKQNWYNEFILEPKRQKIANRIIDEEEYRWAAEVTQLMICEQLDSNDDNIGMFCMGRYDYYADDEDGYDYGDEQGDVI